MKYKVGDWVSLQDRDKFGRIISTENRRYTIAWYDHKYGIKRWKSPVVTFTANFVDEVACQPLDLDLALLGIDPRESPIKA